MQTGTLLQELQEEEKKHKGPSDHSEMVTLEDLTGPEQVSLPKDRTGQQVQLFEESIKLPEAGELRGMEKTIYSQLEKLKEKELKEKELKEKVKEVGELRELLEIELRKTRKKYDIIILSAGFLGGFGLLLSGVMLSNGFLSWMGVICMAIGLIHFISF